MKFLLILLLIPSLAIAVPCPHPVRHSSAKTAFVKIHACPSTGKHSIHCPGYVIDHIKPLACCGKDAPSNMQWQTIKAGKAKDKIELKTCQ